VNWHEMNEDVRARLGFKVPERRGDPLLHVHILGDKDERGHVVEETAGLYWLVGPRDERVSDVVRYDSRRCTDCREGSDYTFAGVFPTEEAAGLESPPVTEVGGLGVSVVVSKESPFAAGRREER
jgi:hypothetical protein